MLQFRIIDEAFEWDTDKADASVVKHNVMFAAIEYALSARGCRRAPKESNTKMDEQTVPDADEMLPEYDFSNGVVGKYAHRFAATQPVLVELAPDVAPAFPDSAAVNEALRTLLRIVRNMPPVLHGR